MKCYRCGKKVKFQTDHLTLVNTGAGPIFIKTCGNYNDPSDYWGSEYSYSDALSYYMLGISGVSGSKAGSGLRMIIIDEAENKPEDMEKYWTKNWEEIIKENKIEE